MGSKDTKERMRKRRQREKLRSAGTWGGISILIIAILGTLIWTAVRPAIGEAVPIMASSDHVPLGEDPGPFDTDPPTSGMHYTTPLNSGFYDEVTAEEVGPYPEGYLVHNLEHGYVIFWYNCALLDDAECDLLEDQLQEVIEDAREVKVIAFPRDSIDVPVVATSWGRMLKFEKFDTKLANRFVSRNRNEAPEPQAP